jgi:RNA polymerase-associated protein CTR9
LLDYEQSLSLLDNIPEEELVAVDRVNEIKPELLNNIAVMHHSLNHSEEAERYYSLAIQESETPKESETEKHLKLTMSYNLARLYEDRCESDKAAAIYRKITEDYPSYADGKVNDNNK